MAEQDKPFVCYRAPGSIKVMPRNTAGWRAFALWMFAFTLVMGIYLVALMKLHSGQAIAWLTGCYLVVTLIWAVSMIRWMMARSEVIDVNELLKLKRETDEQKRRGGH